MKECFYIIFLNKQKLKLSSMYKLITKINVSIKILYILVYIYVKCNTYT